MIDNCLRLPVPFEILDAAADKALKKITIGPGQSPALYVLSAVKRLTNGPETRYKLAYVLWPFGLDFGAVQVSRVNDKESLLAVIEPEVFDRTESLASEVNAFTGRVVDSETGPPQFKLTFTAKVDEMIRRQYTLDFRRIIRRFLIPLKEDLAGQSFTFTPPRRQTSPDGVEWFPHYFYGNRPASPFPAWFPKSKEKQAQWEQAYSSITGLQREYDFLFEQGDVQTRRLKIEDMRAKLALDMNWEPKRRTLKNIIKAGEMDIFCLIE